MSTHRRDVKSPEDLNTLLSGDVTGISSISLSTYTFRPTDEHVRAIGARLGTQLTYLSLGSADTGWGSGITCDAVKELVRACPNLTHLRLESCTQIDNTTFHAIVSGCPNMKELTVSGNDKITGKLKGREAIQPLIDGAAQKLTRLSVYDQGISHADLAALNRVRGRTMEIGGGQSDGDSMAAQMVMRMEGRDWGDNIYSNRDSYGRYVSDEDGVYDHEDGYNDYGDGCCDYEDGYYEDGYYEGGYNGGYNGHYIGGYPDPIHAANAVGSRLGPRRHEEPFPGQPS